MTKAFPLFAALTLGTALHAADLGGVMLKVGSDTTSPPMEYIDPDSGAIVGFDVDLVTAICVKINCKAEFITTGWDGIFTALQEGQFDLVASGVSITEDRQKVMDFTAPYLVSGQAILVRAADAALTVEDFRSGKHKLSAQSNTTDAATAEEIAGKDNVQAYDAFNGSVLALRNGDVDGVVINRANAAAYEAEFAGELVVTIRDLKTDPLGLVFRKGDERAEAFDEGLEAIRADGTLDALIQRYWATE